MSVVETRWRPTTSSVEKKNTKYALASAIIEVWGMAEEIGDEKVKNRLLSILLRVL